MLAPQKTPQFFYEAVSDYVSALNVSIDRIAPFAGLHPEQLRRLGKDGKHWTLAPNAIVRLIDAGDLLGNGIPSDLKGIWEKHLKVASLYTILVIAAYRRTETAWPHSPDDYKFMWDMAHNLATRTTFLVYYAEEGSSNPDVPSLSIDAQAIDRQWWTEPIETEDDILSRLAEISKTWKDHNKATFLP